MKTASDIGYGGMDALTFSRFHNTAVLSRLAKKVAMLLGFDCTDLGGYNSAVQPSTLMDSRPVSTPSCTGRNLSFSHLSRIRL